MQFVIDPFHTQQDRYPANVAIVHVHSFLVLKKKHLPVISPGISLASFIQSHALASESQVVGQRYRRWAGNNPLLIQCLVLAVLSYHCTGTLLGQR